MRKVTPMMQQYFDIKEEYQEHILFFRLGDFYEMFFDDAKVASKELDLTLTGRDCGEEERAPMCGIPYHSAEGYIARLVEKGFKVAICEQMEDPALAKGIVKRDIVRVITPGTVVEASMLDESRNNFIASFYVEGKRSGLAFADVSTGEVYVTGFSENVENSVINELSKFSPREVIANLKGAGCKEVSAFVRERLLALFECVEEPSVNYEKDIKNIKEQFDNMKSGQEDFFSSKEMVLAVGNLLSYLKKTQKVELSHISVLNVYYKGQFMDIDVTARRNLELTETMQRKEKRGSLLWVLDKTKTAMGSRLLRKWIEQPLITITAIGKRHNAVAELVKNNVARNDIQAALDHVYDLERLLSRIVYATANGRDLVSLSATLKMIPPIKAALNGCACNYLKDLNEGTEDIQEVYDLIDKAIVEDPPFTIREGNMIQTGFHEEVDKLRSIIADAKGYIAQMESSQRSQTGIKNLKIGYNRVFGYYIEVTKSYYDLVPPEYIRKQTLSNCERFITQELKEFENLVLNAQDKITALEYEIFCEIRQQVGQHIHRIQKTAFSISQIDVLCSFAETAEINRYCMPQMDLGDEIIIKGGRHPVVEKVQRDALFVPNDTLLNGTDKRMMLITGPNMAGKSTYMRQVALIIVMAHIGSFVPADSASIGICDKIFTRVGASDDLSAGQSTFMVEMSEVAYILKNATRKSLIIYDEIGRGTSTYDGLSIAQAVLEYTASKKSLGAKTLFATHYHELTELEGTVEGLKNYCVAVKKRGDDITFLRKIIAGAADDSYGIEVAMLAGIPQVVTERAKAVLADIENGDTGKRAANDESYHPQSQKEDSGQLSMEQMPHKGIEQKIASVDLNVLTPIEGLNILYELKKMLNNG